MIETHDKLPDDVTLCFLFQTAPISPGQNVWILLIFLVWFLGSKYPDHQNSHTTFTVGFRFCYQKSKINIKKHYSRERGKCGSWKWCVISVLSQQFVPTRQESKRNLAVSNKISWIWTQIYVVKKIFYLFLAAETSIAIKNFRSG